MHVVAEDDPEGIFKRDDIVTEQQRAGFNIPVKSMRDLSPEEFRALHFGSFPEPDQAEVIRQLQTDPALRRGYDIAEHQLRKLLQDYDAAVAGLLSGIQLGGTHLDTALEFARNLTPMPDSIWDHERTPAS